MTPYCFAVRARASLLAVAAFALASVAAAQRGNIVAYEPLSQGVTAELPASSSYVLSVTCPPAVRSFPQTVTLRVAATSVPLGDIATALSYVSLSKDTLTFTAAGETQSVTVTLNFPVTALSTLVPTGAYMYQVYTDGWPAGFIDNGSGINAGVSVPVLGVGVPPSVAITAPAEGTVFRYQPAEFPAFIPFNYRATTELLSPVVHSIAAETGTWSSMSPVVVTTNGLGTAVVEGGGTLPVSAPGEYVVQVTATNAVGMATATSSYVVRVSAPPPVVTISSPVSGATFAHRQGDPATIVTVDFSAISSFGGIRTLTATIDGVPQTFVPSGIGTLEAKGTLHLPYTSAGAHTVVVSTTDDNGSASAQTSFTINVVAPKPVLAITQPQANQVFTLPAGVSTLSVPYSFSTTSNNGFVVNTVSAVLGGTTLAPATTGLGTPAAISSGTLANLGPGTYTLTASGTSAGVSVQGTVTFEVRGATLPPIVEINTPPDGATYSMDGACMLLPLKFTAESQNDEGVLTKLTATLDGEPVFVLPLGLGRGEAVGLGLLKITTSGTHTLVVTATDAFGTASVTHTFDVTANTGRTVSGEVFFDADGDGREDSAEFGLAGVTVKLLNASNQVVASDATNACGQYGFNRIAPGTYTLVTAGRRGLLPTTPARTITVAGANVTAAEIGLGLDFAALRTMRADGFTIGFWKNNLSKAIAGKTSGTQISKAKLAAYTCDIGDFALSPFDDLTMKCAVDYMDSKSSAAVDLLAKQLVASEYNYQNGAYVDGDATLTFLFLYWGEQVMRNSGQYSRSYILWAKDWFDAYNNSHGSVVDGPAP